MDDYAAFVAGKLTRVPPTGLSEVPALNPKLYPHQRDLVTWALRHGRAALFADTGLGKTMMQLEWARVVHEHTRQPVIILAPLAVAAQTVAEGASIGVDVRECRQQSDCHDGVNVTNYERLHKFDPSWFGAVVLDESGCIKHQDSKTFATLTDAFSATPWRLCATATPAPNDYTELGTHAEFLGICSRAEMLAEYFVHDGGETQTWRLKGHARDVYWRWVAGWGAMVKKPSDLGYDDDGYALPPFRTHEHVVPISEVEVLAAGRLFATDAKTLMERRQARRQTVYGRVDKVAEIVNAANRPWVVWCDLNAESAALREAIHGAVEVTGSMEIEEKEAANEWFVGKRCICNEPALRRKLTAWRETNASTWPNTTERTATSASLSQFDTSRSTESSGASTWPNTTERTLRSSPGEHLSSKPNTIGDDESGMPLTPSTERSSRLASGPGTHLPDETSGCGPHSESTLSNTTPSSPAKAAGVPSVDASTLTPMADDWRLTTPTAMAESGGFSAPTAIRGSGSLEMTPVRSIEHQCTCGHLSGRRILVSKPSIFGHGLNWQHCADMAFCGVTDSWEAYYQAVRRCWRFGQKREVNVHVVTAETEGAVVANLARKDAAAELMGVELSAATRDAVRLEVTGQARRTNAYEPLKEMEIPRWLLS